MCIYACMYLGVYIHITYACMCLVSMCECKYVFVCVRVFVRTTDRRGFLLFLILLQFALHDAKNGNFTLCILMSKLKFKLNFGVFKYGI